MSGYLAKNGSDSFQPAQLFAGDKEVVTKALPVKSGVTLVANSILALDASDELVEWVPGGAGTLDQVVGISCEAIDTSGGAASHPVYISGFFNTDQLNWPGGVTATQKFNAFKGTELEHQTLGYSG